MKFDKYYEQLLKNDQVNNDFVTYLSCTHIFNTLTERDSVTNKEIQCSGDHLSKVYDTNSVNFDMPLCFVNDDVLNIFNYIYPHLKNILRNPHNQIIKEQQLIDKARLKVLDDKTLKWLSPKSGGSIKEKLANVDKVLSTKKRFSVDLKENQVSLKCFDMVRRLLNQKIELYETYPNLFSKLDENTKDDTSHKINRIRTIIKNDFDEVQLKDHSEPNNALIGNVDYASLWHSYLTIKKSDKDYSDSFSIFKKAFFISLIFRIMKDYDFIEKYSFNKDAFDYVLYQISTTSLREISFTRNYSIIIKNLDISKSQSEIESQIEYNFSLEKIEDNSNRGIPFKLFINGKEIRTDYADLKGCSECIEFVLKVLKLENTKKINTAESPFQVDFLSINSFDNKLYGEKNDTPLVINDGENSFYANAIFDCNQKLLTLNTINDKDYYSLLKLCDSKINLAKNNIIIYDINDNYDQFSSAKLRSTLTSIYPNSYPVWRSILAAETFGNNKAKLVIDLCGKEMSISQIGFKKNKYIHYGPDDIPLYLKVLTEYDLYNDYLSLYEEKFGEIPSIVKEKFIFSGYLQDTILNKKMHILSYENSYYTLRYDGKIVNEIIKNFDDFILQLTANYDEKTLIIIAPDFIKSSKPYILLNSMLKTGASKIATYVRKKEITWYEHLPEISLEIIKNGMYDTLKIVENREVENIIGLKKSIDVKEHFVLSAGQKEYRLPLIKSFIGENNKTFEAILTDESFPLDHDAEVSLYIEYNFESENTYDLFFTAVGKEPFTKIEAKWVESVSEKNLINPKLSKKFSNTEEILKIATSFRKYKITDLQYDLNNLRSKKLKVTEAYKNLAKHLFYTANDLQIIKSCGDKEIYNGVLQVLDYIDFNNIVINAYNNCAKYYSLAIDAKDERKGNFKIWHTIMKQIEQCYVSLTFDKKLILNNELFIPSASIGRYIGEYPNDYEVLNKAYEILMHSIAGKTKFIGDPDLQELLDRMTSAIVADPYVFETVVETNCSFVLSLAKVIIYVLRDIANYKWEGEHAENESPREIGFEVRFCIELLVPLLLCRDLPLFSQFKPGEKYANEALYYLKIINKNLTKALDNWTENKKPNLKIKYRMMVEKPKELEHVEMIIYCLILYLSGDVKANLIRMVEDND